MNAHALGGLQVLDLSRILAGPTAAQILGDFGAEVIKVERPGKGDDGRSLGGAALRAPDGTETDFSPMHVCANRNKKSICIDFTKPEGADLLRQLAGWADVLVENFKVGDLKRFALDYASLAAINPRLVYCSITGFGQTGPYAPRAVFDSVFQAMSGLMSTTGFADDLPNGGPLRVGVPITDFIGGAIDSVGGETLSWLTRTMQPGGTIASVGNVGGATLETTVMPFILRGVTLIGIAAYPPASRDRLWHRIWEDMRPRRWREYTRVIGLGELHDSLAALLARRTSGRILVKPDLAEHLRSDE